MSDIARMPMAFGLVRAARQIRFARAPLVMKVFEPLMT
jgi:hypothetical protein